MSRLSSDPASSTVSTLYAASTTALSSSSNTDTRTTIPTNSASISLNLATSHVGTSTEEASTISSLGSASTSSTVPTVSSTIVQWGPAVTAAPLPSSASQSPEVAPAQSSVGGFSKGSKQLTISTTVIGGVLIIAILLYALHRRRKGATMSEIIRFQRHDPSTILLTPRPNEERLTALPIYQESRYSVRWSRHASMANLPPPIGRKAAVPPEISRRFHQQNPYIKHTWNTSRSSFAPNKPPKTPIKDERSFFIDATPPPPLKQPEMAHVRVASRSSSQTRMTKWSSGDTTKSQLRISVREASPVEALPGTQQASPHSNENLQDRWSWTNSQAPPTPRMYAHSLRSSRSSLPRFRVIKDWVRSQAERIDEERSALSRTGTKVVLKNKASKPNLAPRTGSKTGHNVEV